MFDTILFSLESLLEHLQEVGKLDFDLNLQVFQSQSALMSNT